MPSFIYLDPDVVEEMPKRARIAFLARCARRISPILDMKRDERKYGRAIRSAKKLVEQLELVAGTADLSFRLRADGKTAKSWWRDIREVIKSGEDVVPLTTAIECIERAHAAAYDVSSAGIAQTTGAATIAVQIYGDAVTDDLQRAQSSDFRLLLVTAKAEQWNDETPVTPEFFGPLWPNGVSSEWIGQERTSENCELSITIEIPEGTSDNDVLKYVEELVTKADGLHRAYGGHGLTIDIGNVDIERDAAVPAGSR